MDHFKLTDYEKYLFNQGNYFKAYEKMGAHLIEVDNVTGFHFEVWVPNVKAVYVVGDFNEWSLSDPLTYDKDTELWYGFSPDIKTQAIYKYAIITTDDQIIYKADPYSFYSEQPPTQSMPSKKLASVYFFRFSI